MTCDAHPQGRRVLPAVLWAAGFPGQAEWVRVVWLGAMLGAAGSLGVVRCGFMRLAVVGAADRILR